MFQTMRTAFGLVLLIVVMVFPEQSIAQLGPSNTEDNRVGVISNQPPSPVVTHAWSETQWKLAYGVWATFCLTLGLLFLSMWLSGEYWTGRHFKVFTLILTLNVGLLLIITGYTDAQIASMMGLLGTIVGYVLGSTTGRNRAPGTGATEEPKKPTAG